MAAAKPRRRASPPVLPDELVEEILLRLPPDEPACLLRASLISKAWGRAISSPAFRRRLHELHGTPPVLGFLHNWVWERTPRFIPTTSSSFSLAAPDCQTWRALDCRHGRALFHSRGQDAQELLVWEPITGAQRRVPVPSLFEAIRVFRNTLCGNGEEFYPGAAVFCAADGCDHRDCHGDPFGLVFVFTDLDMGAAYDDREFDICACVFSSETGEWSTRISYLSSKFMEFMDHSSVLVGRSLLYFMSDDLLILEYDLASHSMTVILPPGYRPGYRSSYVGRCNIILTEDGGLGFAEYSNPNLKLWAREASDGADAGWVLSRVINLVNLLPVGALLDADSGVRVVDFAEGASAIFLNTADGIFALELQLEKATKVCDKLTVGNLIAVVSFYTPVPRGAHQDPPSSGPSEAAGGQEGGETEKAIEQPHLLFDRRSNATKEGDFVNACFSHAVKTRGLGYDEVPLECASTEYGCALLHKAQEVEDPLDDVPKIVPNEESVTGAAKKDDGGNSKTSHSDVEDAAAPSRKGDPEEGWMLHKSSASSVGSVSLQLGNMGVALLPIFFFTAM